jgi:hypothetical protein
VRFTFTTSQVVYRTYDVEAKSRVEAIETIFQALEFGLADTHPNVEFIGDREEDEEFNP